ncbi:MAG: class I ribonucleotide reductase maintenance protein YfaE [Conchiformibius sp.]|nr:class I ribonucleotide reductase maintenance protein YfaE [Conchiformibius sp.]
MPRITTTDSTFELPPHETLLDALERTGHQVEYQCKNGYCGSCRLKLLSGSVSYRDVPMAFVMPDEILPCCCRVDGDIAVACCLRQKKHD